jgi:nuclear transport factor 2 (NTF2) superfamily protein
VETRTLHPEQREREWHILGGAERQRQGIGKPFYLNLWENLDTIDLIQSERFEHWERMAGRFQYEFRTRISNKGQYLASYHYNSSGYNQGPFNREFHKRQVRKEYSASINNGPQHENHKK